MAAHGASKANSPALDDTGLPFWEDYSRNVEFRPSVASKVRAAMPLAHAFSKSRRNSPTPSGAVHTIRRYRVYTYYGPSRWTDDRYDED